MNKLTYGISALLVLGLVGCATQLRSDPQLEMARSTVEAAAADPAAIKYAASDVEQARRLLSRSDAASAERGSKESVEHYSYLATRMAQVAQQRGKARVAEERVAASQEERQRIQLSARTAEVDRARQVAQSAQVKTESAQAELAATREQLGAAQSANEELARELSDLQGKQTPRGVVLTLGDVLFDTGKADLKSGSLRSIDQLATFLNAHPERRVAIEGFTDSVGSDSYNLQLSQRRADAVKAMILSRGVAPERVTATGLGESFAVAGNESPGGRQLNRRVEVIISNDASEVPARRAAN